MSVHHEICKADSNTGTHLVAVNNLAELDDLDLVLQRVAPPAMGRFYVGVVQQPGASSLATGWIDITGLTLDPLLWNVGEPDDLDGTENALEQLAVINPSGRLLDVSGTASYGAVCECDGLPVSAIAEQVIP